MIFDRFRVTVALFDAWYRSMEVLSLQRPREVEYINQLHVLEMIARCRAD